MSLNNTFNSKSRITKPRIKELTIFHLNIQGLINHLDELSLHFSPENANILALSETHLKPNIQDSEILFNNYQIIRRDRTDRKNGGVCFYISKLIEFIRETKFEHPNIESVVLKLLSPEKKPIIVCVIYRPPHTPVIWYDYLYSMLENISLLKMETIILGDFNLDMSTLYNAQMPININPPKIIQLMSDFHLKQLIKEPTRTTSNTQTIIDLIFVSDEDKIKMSNVINLNISDHYPIHVVRNVQIKDKTYVHKFSFYRSMKMFNKSAYLKDICKVDWHSIFNTTILDEIIGNFNNLLISVINKHCPLRKRRVKHQELPPWFNTEISNAISQRDKTNKSKYPQLYKQRRNKVTSLIRKHKVRTCRKEIMSSKNTSNLWKFINKKYKKERPNIKSINVNNQTINQNDDICNAFNSFFVNITDEYNVHKDIDNYKKSVHFKRLKEYTFKKLQNASEFKIAHITVDFIEKYIDNLSVAKSTGLDNISPKFLKIAAKTLSPVLAQIINTYIDNSYFPCAWKKAKVIPVYKNGSQEALGNYRPISILPCLSKIFERHMANSLQDYLLENNLLNSSQSGFRPNHSCESALLSLINYFQKTINDGELICSIFLDFRKAFDIVDYDLLLLKLETYKFSNAALNLFKSYLQQRFQITNINSCFSKYLPNKSGVPQGSILGPILFILFINDFSLGLFNTRIDMYADDTTITISSKTITDIKTIANKLLSKVYDWCQCNSMVINENKTKFMIITNHQKRSLISNELELKLEINGKNIQRTCNEKLLGVYINEDLKWDFHISKLCEQISAKLHLFNRLKVYMDVPTRVLFYNAYMFSIMTYCSPVWGKSSNASNDRLLKLQKRIARSIFDKPYDFPHSELFKKLNWLEFQDLVDYRILLMTYKSLKNLAPTYLRELFEYKKPGQYSLRSEEIPYLKIPLHRTALYANSFSVLGARLYNNILSYGIKTELSYSSFKEKVFNYLKLMKTKVTQLSN